MAKESFQNTEKDILKKLKMSHRDEAVKRLRKVILTGSAQFVGRDMMRLKY